MIYIIYTHYDLKLNEHKYNKEHQLGLSLLKYALKNKYQINTSLHFVYNANGKPSLKDYDHIHFNISHCDHYVAVALSDHPIGIDIEHVGISNPTMRKKVLTSKELEYCQNSSSIEDTFYKYWTLKESYLKWCGKGFSLDPKTISFKLEDDIITSSDPFVHHYQRYIDNECILALTYEKKEKICIESYEKKMDSAYS